MIYICEYLTAAGRSSRSLARAIAAASASGKSGRLRQQRQALASTAGQPPALLAVPTAWPRRDRERLVQLFFEKFGVCGLYIGDRALMTTYGAGQHLSALVIDMGWDGVGMSAVETLCSHVCHNAPFASSPDRFCDPLSEITPVIDTVVMDQARAHLALGGKHLHIAIRRGLDADIQFKREYGQAVDETLVRYLVDNVCDLAPAPFETDASKGRKEREIARTTITTDDLKYSVGDVRQRAFEILFSPKQALASTGLIIPLGLGDLVNEALLSCDMDKRAALLQNIIVTGPMSHLKGRVRFMQRPSVSVVSDTRHPPTLLSTHSPCHRSKAAT